MNDRILLRDLVVAATVGVPDLERAAPQRLRLDVVLEGDFCDGSDDLESTIDYAAVAEWLRVECGRQPGRLLETLAARLAEGLLAGWPRLVAVELEVRKNILPATRNVGVRVRRERSGGV
jgi:dihydroneopterin aldolase